MFFFLLFQGFKIHFQLQRQPRLNFLPCISERQICIKVIKCCVDTRVSLIFPRSLSFKIGIVFSCAVICEFCSLVWQTRLVAYRFFVSHQRQIYLKVIKCCVDTRVIRGKLEWQETIPGPWIIAQNYFCSLTVNLFSTSPFFRRALVGLCVFSSLDSHILAVTWTPGVL